MKKKRKDPRQLNKASVIRLLIFVLVVALIEIAAGIFVYTQFAKKTYVREYESYQLQCDELSADLYENKKDILTEIESNDAALAEVVDYLNNNGKFDYYLIFAENQSGKILYKGDLLTGGDNLKNDYNLSYEKYSLYEKGGEVYFYSPSKIGDTVYRIGTFKNFTQNRKNITNLLGNVLATLIVAGVTVVAAFVAYAFICGNRPKLRGFKYRLTLDAGTGKITSSNAAFKKEFFSVSEIKAPETLDKKSINLLSLSATEGEKIIALRLDSIGGQTKVFADDVANADMFVSTSGESEVGEDGRSTASLSKLFESFVAKGKRTLVGILFITKLEQIKTLFGKQMATDVQRLILKKAREKFTYAFDIDFGYIGIAFPDGKKLDNILTDLEDIHRYISTPIKMGENLFTLEIKSGFALCDSNMSELTFEYGYKAAEAARQRAIDTGVADYLVYNEAQRKLYDKYFITFDIKQMLAEGAFEMEYQPQYNIKEERIEGFEALFRVKKSWNVNVDTFSFITYAERTGAMVQLGDFIFDTGMQFAKKLEGKNVSVSLNVSPVQLMQAGFTENFLKIYKKYDLKPGSICVEITESFLMTNFTETLKKLAILNSNGIDVHLDDFGTEYSSLLYIKKLPITTIKIDKEFVKDVLVSKESQAIIKFITNIAKLLNRTTICEGVETPQEYDMLNYLGCDTIQGWVIGKSMKPEAALEIVDTFDYKKVVSAFNDGK